MDHFENEKSKFKDRKQSSSKDFSKLSNRNPGKLVEVQEIFKPFDLNS